MQFRCPLRLCYSARAIMGSLLFFAFSWWGILVRIVAIVHFIRRRPDTYWLWIILIHWMGADVLFQQATAISTLSETYYNYASFLAAQNRNAEAKEWAQRILAKKPTMPGYLRRRERPWFRRANSLLKRLS